MLADLVTRRPLLWVNLTYFPLVACIQFLARAEQIRSSAISVGLTVMAVAVSAALIWKWSYLNPWWRRYLGAVALYSFVIAGLLVGAS